MTTNGTSIEQRNIVLVPFPFSDLSSIKQRPALILSNREHNTHNEDIICCAITSNPREYAQSIKIAKSDLERGGLHLDSVVKPNKIFTLHQSLVRKAVGKLNAAKTEEIIKNLNIFIEIDGEP